ncbi:peptide transporter [Primorskyibacter flagellatus]|uniref:Peptide transporter n=1 Tax=Primorskyibacter flagellatus TaxID=1387277 RepID=A0A917AG60_9RHOB|nr:ShlB/FhaC/HecB family hemolysin secretion/activation protein [Primorskyibacter flagellatus]GGE50334.1 peptide transporter [Primorskyibacter flagellatus]
MRRLGIAAVALATGLGLAGVATAQAVTDPLVEQRRVQELSERTSALGGFRPQGGAPDPGPAQARGGPCFPIDRIEVTGVTLLPEVTLARLMAPFAPACMQGADIQSAMRALDGAYADKGYITTRSYIPAQNLTTGVLVLEVLEGHVEGIYLVGEAEELTGPRARRQIATAFPGAATRPFNLRDFEQGLDQMNRLGSVEATVRLQPGDTPGGSHVIVQRLQQDRFRGLGRFDTLASEGTGRNRLTFETTVDDLFGANDTWTVGLAGTENTNALTLSGSVPFGYTTVQLDLGYSEYLVPLSPAAELFGTSTNVSLSVTRMLARGQFSTTEGSVTLGVRDGTRVINFAALTPQRVATLSFGLRHIRIGEQARNSYDATLSFGLDAFGATRDPASPARDEPRAQFARLEFGWQRQGAFGAAGTLVTDLRAQISPHTLYGSEQMAIGSFSTVRGYEEAVGAGETGAYLRNDLYLAADVWTRLLPAAMRQTAATRIQPHLFLDAGVVRDRATGRRTHAAGAGLGLSWSFGRFTASGIIGVPLIDPFGRPGIGGPLIQVRADAKLW